MIRRAESKDIDAILDLLLQVLMVHHNGRPDLFKPDCTKYNHEELEEIIKDDSRPIFVYDDDENGVVGYAFCVHQEHPDDNVLTPIKTLYIDDICISENFRRHGVGKSILDYVKTFAKENGYYNITLNVWECNPSADAFYRSQGLIPYKTGMEMIL